jgi:hypothetical protein
MPRSHVCAHTREKRVYTNMAILFEESSKYPIFTKFNHFSDEFLLMYD